MQKRLIVVGVGLAALVIAATVVWFVVSQRQLNTRLRADNELRTAIQQAESLPEAAEWSEVVRQVQSVLAIANKNRKLADEQLLARIPRLEQFMHRSEHEEEFRKVFEQISAQNAIYMKAVNDHAEKTKADPTDKALVNLDMADDIWRQSIEAAKKALETLEATDESIKAATLTLGSNADSDARSNARSSSLATLRATIDVGTRERQALAETRKTAAKMLADLDAQKQKLKAIEREKEAAAQAEKAAAGELDRAEKGFEGFAARLLRLLSDSTARVTYGDTFRYSTKRGGAYPLEGRMVITSVAHSSGSVWRDEITVRLIFVNDLNGHGAPKWEVATVDTASTMDGKGYDNADHRRLNREIIELHVNRLTQLGQNP